MAIQVISSVCLTTKRQLALHLRHGVNHFAQIVEFRLRLNQLSLRVVCSSCCFVFFFLFFNIHMQPTPKSLQNETQSHKKREFTSFLL